jgi:hypothetical protein
MNRAQELLDDALGLLRLHGFQPDVQERGTRHIKVRWIDAGRRYTLTVSRSPSTSHARQQSLATLRRLLRNGDGGARQ